MQNVTNCDMICDIFIGDDVNYFSQSWIWNDNDFNHMIAIHESGTLTPQQGSNNRLGMGFSRLLFIEGTKFHSKFRANISIHPFAFWILAHSEL